MKPEFPRLVHRTTEDLVERCQLASEEEDPREVFRLQVLEDLEEERGLLYRFGAVGLAVVFAILCRQILMELI